MTLNRTQQIAQIDKLDGPTEIDVSLYAYDALGRRIWKYDPTAAAQNVYYYHNDQWQILADHDGTGFGKTSIAT